jgi:two-component system sensor histidine kinase/response regulator
MGESSKKLYAYRCLKCHKTLAKGDYHSASLEIKCHRCGTINAVIEDTNDQVIITDPEGVILYANQWVAEATGYSLSDIIGKRPSLWGNQMPKEFYRDLWRQIKEEKRAAVVRVRNRKKDGTPFQGILRISAILDERGEVKFFVGVTTVVADSPILNQDNA